MNAVEAEGLEGKGDDHANGFGHQSAAGEGLTHPVAQSHILGGAATDVGKRQPADEALGSVLAQEDEEGMIGTGAGLLASPAQTFKIDALGEIGFAPARLERAKEVAAVPAQGAPRGVVGRPRGAQGEAPTHQHRRLVARKPGEHHGAPDLPRKLRPDTFGVGQPGYRADAGKRNPVRIEDLTGDQLHPVGGDAIDAVDRLLQRNGTPPDDLLARQLAGPRRGTFQRHQKPGTDLVADPHHLFISDALGGTAKLVEYYRQQLPHLFLAGGGCDAEDAAVGKGPMEGVDGVAETALLADLLKQPRTHAAAKDGGEDLYGVEAVGVVGAAFQAENDVGLLVVGYEPLLAPDIAGLLRLGSPTRLQAAEAFGGDLDEGIVIDIASGTQDHMVVDIVALHEAANGVGTEAVDRVDGPEDRPADRLVRVGG